MRLSSSLALSRSTCCHSRYALLLFVGGAVAAGVFVARLAYNPALREASGSGARPEEIRSATLGAAANQRHPRSNQIAAGTDVTANASAPATPDGRHGTSEQDVASIEDGQRPGSANQSRGSLGMNTSKALSADGSKLVPRRDALLRQRRDLGAALFFQATPVDDATRSNLLQAISKYENAILQDPMVSLPENEAYKNFKQEVCDALGAERGHYFIKLRADSLFVPIAEDLAARCAADGDPTPPSAIAAITMTLAENLHDPLYPRPLLMRPDGVPLSEYQAYKDAAKVLTPRQMNVFKQLWAEHPYPKIAGQ